MVLPPSPAPWDNALPYFRFHERRYRLLLDLAAKSLARSGTVEPKLLDIAPSFEVILIGQRFPNAAVDTGGYFDQRFATPSGAHHPIDLNEVGNPDQFPVIGPYNLILAGEVVEHLRTSPAAVLRCLRSVLLPGGEIILQTPNAASLAKRYNLLRGRNPNMEIADVPDPSHHWREYTVPELIDAGRAAGLETLSVVMTNPYLHEGDRARFYLQICRFVPPRFRDCITIVYRRAES